MPDYKPADLFVGVIDVFAILLPGAVVAYCYADLANAHLFGHLLPKLAGDWRDLLVFAFAAYLIGHFVFLAGSRVDDRGGDAYRESHYAKKDRMLLQTAKKRKWTQMPPLFRVSDILMSLVDCQRRGHEFEMLEASEVHVINTFQWATAMVELRAPGAAAEVQRLEADSKFFRSLIVAIGLVTPVLLYNAWFDPRNATAQSATHPYALAVTIVALLAVWRLSFIRYVEQRQKSIRLAYTYFIALPSLPADVTEERLGV